jgi:hypothetical protein
LLKYLFGKYAEVVGVPDKQDAFNVLASQSHIVALDNMDEAYNWMQDKLARISTGTKEVVRKLFTTNDSPNHPLPLFHCDHVRERRITIDEEILWIDVSC